MGRSEKSIEAALSGAELVEQALELDSPAIALQKALAALNERERMAVNLFRSGDVKTKRAALDAAGFAECTANKPGKVFDRPHIQAVLMLSEKVNTPLQVVDADSFLLDLIELAHADPIDALDQKTGKVLPVGEWPKPLRRMVKKLDFNVLGGVESVTFEGRAVIQGMVGKHRNIKAFDQKTIERRVYVVRDYTGKLGPNGKPVTQGPQPKLVDGERIGQVEGSPRSSFEFPRPETVEPGATDARRHGRTLGVADADDVSEIDRGHIPLRR